MRTLAIGAGRNQVERPAPAGQGAAPDLDRDPIARALAVLASAAIGSKAQPTSPFRRFNRLLAAIRPRAAADVEEPRPANQPLVRPAFDSGQAQPGRGMEARPECHPSSRGPRRRLSARRRWRRQVGRITSRRPIRRTGKWAFQALAQSASWTTDSSSSPIGRSSNACRWPAHPGRRGRLARQVRVAAGQVGAGRLSNLDRPGRTEAPCRSAPAWPTLVDPASARNGTGSR